MIDKKKLSEQDICSKYVLPAIINSGWDGLTQVFEQVSFTDGRIYVRGKLTARGERKRADIVLYYQDNAIAVVEVKDNKHSARAGIQQALDYARILDIPCVFSTNGDRFLFHDRTAHDDSIEQELGMDEFPSLNVLWEKYKLYKGISTTTSEKIITQKYFSDGSGRKPRYYQQIAINRSVEAISNGQNRVLLVMATGTGKPILLFKSFIDYGKVGQKNGFYS
jgi:type I restriction enzyme R subunit